MLHEKDSEIPSRQCFLKDGSKHFRLPAVKPRGGFVEQDHVEPSGQNGGQLDKTLLSDREQPNLRSQRCSIPVRASASSVAPEIRCAAERELKHLCERVPASHCGFTTQLDVLTNRQRVEELGPLECAPETSFCPMRRAEASQVLISQKDPTRGGADQATAGVEERRLARAIWPDQPCDPSLRGLKAYRVDCFHPTIRNGDAPDRQARSALS